MLSVLQVYHRSNCRMNYECNNCNLTILVVVCSLCFCGYILACKGLKSASSLFFLSFLSFFLYVCNTVVTCYCMSVLWNSNAKTQLHKVASESCRDLISRWVGINNCSELNFKSENIFHLWSCEWQLFITSVISMQTKHARCDGKYAFNYFFQPNIL